jgi:hypothetical protein
MVITQSNQGHWHFAETRNQFGHAQVGLWSVVHNADLPHLFGQHMQQVRQRR